MNNSFKDINEVKIFEKNLIRYCEENNRFGYYQYFGLVNWFKYCIEKGEIGAKIFTAILDLKFHFIFLDLDNVRAIKDWDNIFKGKENINIIEDYSGFEMSVKVLEHLSNYVFRYRAIWDKIMGLIVLLYIPDKYKTLSSCKSFKRTFRKLCLEYSEQIKIDGKLISNILEEFDKNFRTPEAHGTGKIRKWILNPSEFNSFYFGNPKYNLTGDYWNTLIQIIDDIEKRELNKNY